MGNFLPGSTSTGTVSLSSGLALELTGAADSTFDITSPAFTARTFDLVTGEGSVVLGGILDLAFTAGQASGETTWHGTPPDADHADGHEADE